MENQTVSQKFGNDPVIGKNQGMKFTTTNVWRLCQLMLDNCLIIAFAYALPHLIFQTIDGCELLSDIKGNFLMHFSFSMVFSI